MGRLRSERDAGRRKVGYNSLPQYFSDMRQVHSLTFGDHLPDLPLLDQVVHAYRKWEAAHFPDEEVRCGIYEEDVKKIWEEGKRATKIHVSRDVAAVVFEYYFNGLWESCAMNLQANNV